MATYQINLYYPTGTKTEMVNAETYTIPAAPSTYFTATYVDATYQLFNSAGISATSTWTISDAFQVCNFYSGWYVEDNGGLVPLYPGDVIKLSDYATSGNVLLLNPLIVAKGIKGTFSDGAWTYKSVKLTGNCNYPGGTNTSITLEKQIRKKYYAESWTKINGTTLSEAVTPGTTTTVKLSGYKGGHLTIEGLLDKEGSWQRAGSGTYAALPKPTRSSDVSKHTVSLVSSSDVTHSSETLKVSTNNSYTFDHWSDTASGGNVVNESEYPVTDTTLYAVWKSTSTVVTTLPQWTSTDSMKYRDDAYRTIALQCYQTAKSTSPYYTKTVKEYEFKPAKHTGWKSGGKTYHIGSVVTLGSGATYTAIWEADAAGDSTFQLYDNVIAHPTPDARVGYTYLGLAQSKTATTPSYSNTAPITITQNMKLYGVWKANGAAKLFTGNAEGFQTYQIWIFDGKSWKLHVPKIFDGKQWKDYI